MVITQGYVTKYHPGHLFFPGPGDGNCVGGLPWLEGAPLAGQF